MSSLFEWVVVIIHFISFDFYVCITKIKFRLLGVYLIWKLATGHQGTGVNQKLKTFYTFVPHLFVLDIGVLGDCCSFQSPGFLLKRSVLENFARSLKTWMHSFHLRIRHIYNLYLQITHNIAKEPGSRQIADRQTEKEDTKKQQRWQTSGFFFTPTRTPITVSSDPLQVAGQIRSTPVWTCLPIAVASQILFLCLNWPLLN